MRLPDDPLAQRLPRRLPSSVRLLAAVAGLIFAAGFVLLLSLAPRYGILLLVAA